MCLPGSACVCMAPLFRGRRWFIRLVFLFGSIGGASCVPLFTSANAQRMGRRRLWVVSPMNNWIIKYIWVNGAASRSREANTQQVLSKWNKFKCKLYAYASARVWVCVYQHKRTGKKQMNVEAKRRRLLSVVPLRRQSTLRGLKRLSGNRLMA